MKRFQYINSIGIISVSALLPLAGNAVSKANSKPNIIFFIADDMYPEMFNCLPEGKGKNLTPNIDCLAAEGVVLTNQYCVSPVSTASRYNCLTGNYASRATNNKLVDFAKTQEGQVVVQWNSFITPTDKTIATYLKQLGYITGFVGKNHVVDDLNQVDQNEKPDLFADPNNPAVKKKLMDAHTSLQNSIKRCGFDFADNLYHDNPDWLGIKALNSQNMDWITDAGLRFINQTGKKPFFLYFATTLPHAPNEPERSWNANPKITATGFLDKELKVQPSRKSIETRIKKAGLAGKGKENLLWLDDALGALIKKLEKDGTLKNTIIFFFNDNGQKAKGTLYEGGIRTQCIIWKHKGFAVGKNLDLPVSNVDFLPTIVELASQEPVKINCDGVSFASALNGNKIQSRETMYFELGYARAVIKGKYKYLALRYPQWAVNYTPAQRKAMLEEYGLFRESFGNERITNDYMLPYGHLEMYPGGGGAEHEIYGTKPGFFDADQLYDLSTDPNELKNLAKDSAHADILEQMKVELKKYVSKLPGKFNI